MSAPIYFVPNGSQEKLRPQTRDPEALNACGLWHIVKDAGPNYSASQITARGPGGFSGTIVAVWNQEPPERLGFYPDRQEWSPVGDGTKLWIGLDSMSPLVPGDIERPAMIAGHRLKLGDGNHWQVPVFRPADGGFGVPYDIYRDDAGEIVHEVREDFRSMWERSGEMWDCYFEAEDNSLDYGHALDYFVDSIAVNYRFDHNLNRVLRLMTSQTWEPVIAATLDLSERLKRWQDQKKTAELSLVGTN